MADAEDPRKRQTLVDSQKVLPPVVAEATSGVAARVRRAGAGSARAGGLA